MLTTMTGRPVRAYHPTATTTVGNRAPRRVSAFVPTPAQCNQTITLTDAQNAGNPALTGTATLTSFTTFNGSGMLSIDGSSMSDGQTNTQDVSAVVRRRRQRRHYHQLRRYHRPRHDHHARVGQLQ